MVLISTIFSFLKDLVFKPDEKFSSDKANPDGNQGDDEMFYEEVSVSQTHYKTDLKSEQQVEKPDQLEFTKKRIVIVSLPNDDISTSLKRDSSQAFFSLYDGMSSSSYKEIGGGHKYVIPDSDKSRSSSLQLIGINTNKKKSSFRIVKTQSHKIIKEEIDDRGNIEKIFRDNLLLVPSSSISTNKEDGVKNPGNIDKKTADLLQIQADLMLEKDPDPNDSIPDREKRAKGKMKRGFVTDNDFNQSKKNIKEILELQNQDQINASQLLRSRVIQHPEFFIL